MAYIAHDVQTVISRLKFAYCAGTNKLCIKLGQGYWDVCVGTWDLGMRREGCGDIKHWTQGRGHGNIKYRGCGR